MILFGSRALHSMQSPLSTVASAFREDGMSLPPEKPRVPIEVPYFIYAKGEQTQGKLVRLCCGDLSAGS